MLQAFSRVFQRQLPGLTASRLFVSFNMNRMFAKSSEQLANVHLRSPSNSFSLTRKKFPKRIVPDLLSDKSGDLLKMKAYHMCQAFDLDRITQTIFPESASRFQPNCVLVNLSEANTQAVTSDFTSPASSSLALVYQFGSVVFLNTEKEERDRVKKLLEDAFSDRFDHRTAQVGFFEDLDVKVLHLVSQLKQEASGSSSGSSTTLSIEDDPSSLGSLSMEEPTKTLSFNEHGDVVSTEPPLLPKLMNDCLLLQEFDRDTLSIISVSMAQSVALEYYIYKIDMLLDEFMRMNMIMAERAGGIDKEFKIRENEKKMLFEMVAQHNALQMGLVSKLRVHHRYESAWKFYKYEITMDMMREEFEIEKRYTQVEVRLESLQRSTKYMIDLMQNQSSQKLEWTIIILIGAEIVVSLMDLFSIDPYKLLSIFN